MSSTQLLDRTGAAGGIHQRRAALMRRSSLSTHTPDSAAVRETARALLPDGPHASSPARRVRPAGVDLYAVLGPSSVRQRTGPVGLAFTGRQELKEMDGGGISRSRDG